MPYPGGLIEQPAGIILRYEKILEVVSDLETAEVERMKAGVPDDRGA